MTFEVEIGGASMDLVAWEPDLSAEHLDAPGASSGVPGNSPNPVLDPRARRCSVRTPRQLGGAISMGTGTQAKGQFHGSGQRGLMRV